MGDDLGSVAEIDGIARDQFDDAILILDRVGLDQPVLIHRLCVHQNRTAIRDEASRIVHRAGRQRDRDADPATVRTVGEQHIFSGVKAERAVGRGERAVIVNGVGDEIKRAAGLNLDRSIIDDWDRGRRAVEYPRAA
jgi:hypothetical protein